VANHPRIAVVDDDESVREALKGLLRSAGYAVAVFASAEAFLTSGQVDDPACLVLDVRMPGMSGVDLQDRLRASRIAVPVVFMTAHADANVRARVLAAGAVDLLQKPFGDQALLGAIEKALGRRPSS